MGLSLGTGRGEQSSGFTSLSGEFASPSQTHLACDFLEKHYLGAHTGQKDGKNRLYSDMQWVIYPITTSESHNRGPTSNTALDHSQSTPHRKLQVGAGAKVHSHGGQQAVVIKYRGNPAGREDVQQVLKNLCSQRKKPRR